MSPNEESGGPRAEQRGTQGPGKNFHVPIMCLFHLKARIQRLSEYTVNSQLIKMNYNFSCVFFPSYMSRRFPHVFFKIPRENCTQRQNLPKTNSRQLLRSICNHESDSGDRTSAGRMWEKTPSCELSLGHSEGQSRPTGQKATAEGGVKLVDVPSPAFVRKKK